VGTVSAALRCAVLCCRDGASIAFLAAGPARLSVGTKQAGLWLTPTVCCPLLQVRRLQPPAQPRAALPPLLRPPHA
jgi:hypothetical protein